MKISMDKLYQTLDGQNVELITVNGRGRVPVIGYIGDRDDPVYWTEDGKHDTCLAYSLAERPIEHVKTIFVGLFNDGSITSASEFAFLKKFDGVIAISAVKVTLTEGVFEEQTL